LSSAYNGIGAQQSIDFKAAVQSSAVKCILLEEPSYLEEVKDLKSDASLECKYVKTFP
jgi:hypothetical protein